MGYIKLVEKPFRASLTLLALLLAQGCGGGAGSGGGGALDTVSSTGVSCDSSGIPFGGGDGSSSTPYQICSATQLAAMSNDAYTTSNFKLMSNINLNAITFSPITFTAGYKGIFDGNSKTISNFTFSDSTTGSIALFKTVDTLGTVQNLNLTGFKIEGASNNAALVSVNNGTITNIAITSSVINGQYNTAGAIASNNGGSVSHVFFSGTVIGNNDVTGAIVADNEGGTLSECGSAGIVLGTSNVGGLVGKSIGGGATILQSFSIADIFLSTQNGLGNQAGGLAGTAKDITNSYFAGTVYGETGSNHVGGLIGVNSSTTTTSYSAASSLSVVGSSPAQFGAINGDAGTVVNSYYYTHAGLPADGTGATALSSAQMSSLASFTSFDTTWQASSSTSYAFPVLAWQSASNPFFGETADTTPYRPLDITQNNSPTTFIGMGNAAVTIGDPNISDQVLTFTNNTGGTITFTGIAIASGSAYTISGGSCSTGTPLTNTSTCTINVHLVPDHIGMKADALVVKYTLGGIARKVAHLLTASVADATFSASASGTFADTAVASTSAIVTYTIADHDVLDGTVTAVHLSNGTDFHVEGTSTCGTGTPVTSNAATCTVDISFTPTMSGGDTDTLIIDYTNPAGITKHLNTDLNANGI